MHALQPTPMPRRPGPRPVRSALLRPGAAPATGPAAQLSEPGDAAEREADRAAAMTLDAPPHPPPAWRCACGGGCPRCDADASSTDGARRLQAIRPAVGAVPRDVGDAGQPLDGPTRHFFEPRFGRDFSPVRVHVDAAAAQSARQMGASAYTYGHHIVFGAQRYSPRSADGRRLIAHELAHVVQQSGLTATVQREKVPTDAGDFETTLFAAHDSGVTIHLTFDPYKDKVDATKIAMVQSVKAFGPTGVAYAVNPNIATRMAAKGAGAGYAIDASGKTNNPLYFDLPDLGPKQALKDTPGRPETDVLGTDTHYQFGYCYKEHPADADKTSFPAGLSDRPEGIKKKGAGMSFETTALAIDGADAGRYYGSVAWGYKMVGTEAAPTVEAHDIKKASAGKPTAKFSTAAKLWNAGKSSGTLVVHPTSAGNKKTAYVQYVGSSAGQPKRLPKDTKLVQKDVVKGTTESMIRAEVLAADGSGTGVEVLIYVADVKDQGDGTANAALPPP